MYFRILLSLIVTGLFWSIPYTISAQNQIVVNQFDLSSEGADVLLTWELPSETQIAEFRIFRRINDEPTSAHVATIQANGSLNYTYLDDDIFKSTSRTLHYELQIVTTGQIHRFSQSLSHNPTSVQRTWGSIKAMFRY